jgi:GT2 family glycosyltransferase
VAVVVPFAGCDEQLETLRWRLAGLALREDDELVIADNRSGAVASEAGDPLAVTAPPRVLRAAGIAAPAFARNRGVEATSAPWLVFLDADVIPPSDLLEAYFVPLPAAGTAILAGGIRDVPPRRPGLAGRRAVAGARLADAITLERPVFPYAQSANCAIRRDAFTAVGGFDETARAGEDADLCFRLAARGFGLERRERACVEHPARANLRMALHQLALHGAGAAWCEARHPGSFPPPRPRALLGRAARSLRRGDGLDLLHMAAFEFGRRRSNRPRRTD